MIIQFCFLGGIFKLFSWKGVPPPPPWQKMPQKRLTFFNPSLTLMNLILQKSIICFFPEIINIPHILDILDILPRLVYLTSLALLIFFVLVFHKILSYNGYNGKSDLSCNSQFSCYPWKVHILDIKANFDIPHTLNISHILENSKNWWGGVK